MCQELVNKLELAKEGMPTKDLEVANEMKLAVDSEFANRCLAVINTSSWGSPPPDNVITSGGSSSSDVLFPPQEAPAEGLDVKTRFCRPQNIYLDKQMLIPSYEF